MEFIIPEFKRKENPIGLYKIWFNDKWFYIGSSKKLRSRFSNWVSMVNNPKFLRNKNIKIILPDISVVRFEIIKTYSSASWLRRNETKEISINWDNPMFLNRCPDANTPKGMKPYFGYIKPPLWKPPLKGIPEYMKPVKVAVFSNNGDLIKICNSKSEVWRDFNFPMQLIKPILLGKRGQPQKYKFKEVLSDGSFKEPPVYKPNRCIPPGKPFIQMQPSGEFIALHTSLKTAAKKLGCSPQLIQRYLKGRGRCNTPKGFIFKYADAV